MAKSKLTDEEKAAKVLGDVEPEKAAETTESEEAETTEEQDDQVEKTAEEIEAEAEAEAETETAETETPTFTKQFTNLKGDSWDSYGPELETAYQNSTSEALRWKTIAEDGAKLVEEAKAVLSNAGQPAQAADPSALQIDSNPEIQYVKSLRQREMVTAFDDFKKDYPQATDQTEFDKFTKASTGVYQAFEATNGRPPTYTELYSGIANLLGWQPAAKSAKKDTAIKESFASSQTVSATQPTSKQSKVSDAEADVYMRLTGKTRTEAVKDLSEVKV